MEFVSCESEYTASRETAVEGVASASKDDSSTESDCGSCGEDDSEDDDAVSKADKPESKKLRRLHRDSCGCKLGPKGTA